MFEAYKLLHDLMWILRSSWLHWARSNGSIEEENHHVSVGFRRLLDSLWVFAKWTGAVRCCDNSPSIYLHCLQRFWLEWMSTWRSTAKNLCLLCIYYRFVAYFDRNSDIIDFPTVTYFVGVSVFLARILQQSNVWVEARWLHAGTQSGTSARSKLCIQKQCKDLT